MRKDDMIYGNKLKNNTNELWMTLFGTHIKVIRNRATVSKDVVQPKLNKKFTRTVEGYIMNYIDENREEIDEKWEGHYCSSRYHDMNEQIVETRATMENENTIKITIKFAWPGRFRIFVDINTLKITQE